VRDKTRRFGVAVLGAAEMCHIGLNNIHLWRRFGCPLKLDFRGLDPSPHRTADILRKAGYTPAEPLPTRCLTRSTLTR
jgi:hypothetical protein